MMRSKSAAAKRVRAARTRMVKLVGKPNLGTEDPLQAEIQMAQLDALLALAHVAIGMEGQVTFEVEKLATQQRWEVRIQRLERQVAGLIAEQNRARPQETPPPQPASRSYWDRLLGKE